MAELDSTTHSRSIHVLVVSADEAFVASCETELPPVLEGELTSVTTVEQALEVLQSGTDVDCIISDHDLSGIDGVAFLQTVRVQFPTLPFILFTSQGSEAAASRAISADVTEYLIKERHSSQWDRLATLIDDAVAYHRSRREFADGEARTRTLLDAARDTIAVVRDGTLEYINRPGLDLLQYDDRAEAVGRPVDEVFDVACTFSLRDLIDDVQDAVRLSDRIEVRLCRPSGDVPVEVTATRIEWEAGPAVALVVRDVGDKRAYKTELEQFKRAVEAAGHVIYITDAEGVITYVNPAFERVTGYEPADAVGQTPGLFSSGEMSEEYYQRLWDTISGGDVWEEEIINERRSGETYHANQTIAPILDGDGEARQFVAIQTDITERTELERELEQYREVVNYLDDPIMVQNTDGEFELLNEAVSAFAGHERENLLGEDESLFMDEETAAFIGERKQDVLDTERAVEYEVSPQFDRTDETAIFNTRRVPYYDEDGELLGTLAICRNVTELKHREENLQRYERAISGATDLIAATDRDGRFIFANPQYCAYHGVEQDEIGDLTLEDVVDEVTYAETKPRFNRVLGGETVRYRTQRTHPSKGERTLDVRYYPLRDDDEVTGVVGVMRDVTDTTNRSVQLRVVDRVLRHNLRNDLTAIRLRAEQLRSGSNQESAEVVGDILRNIDGLLTTSEKSRRITDILAERPQQVSVPVAQQVQQLVPRISQRFPDVDLTATTVDTAVASATVHVDEAIEELVTNAIVHHDCESPSVTVEVTRDDDHVVVCVTDDGGGIPTMDRDVLERGRESDELYHGSGLGLWLVYWIVRRSGGSIAVSDADPRGTTVTITLPRYE